VQIAVALVEVLPPFMPVNFRFNPRTLPLHDGKRFADLLRLVAGVRKFAGRPFRNHDRFSWIEPCDFLVRPIDQAKRIGPRLVVELLAVNTEAQPVDVVGARIVGGREIPGIHRKGVIIRLEHPLNVRAPRARTGSPEKFGAIIR